MHLRRFVYVGLTCAALLSPACGVEGSYVPHGQLAKSEEKLEADEDQPRLGDQLVKFATCMRGKGLAFPDPTESEVEEAGLYIRQHSKPGDPTFEAADDACRLEVFGEPTGGPGGERGPEGGDDPN